MSRVASINTLKTIYFALIHSHIAYGICIYGATTITNLDKILILQNTPVAADLHTQRISNPSKNS